MKQHYGTLDSQVSEFVERHQPQKKQTKRSPYSSALAMRWVLRTSIPILMGLASGMAIEWGEREIGFHNENTIIELSDFTACATTLIVTYTLNSLLNFCWPKTPYNDTDLFNKNSLELNTHETFDKTEETTCERV